MHEYQIIMSSLFRIKSTVFSADAYRKICHNIGIQCPKIWVKCMYVSLADADRKICHNIGIQCPKCECNVSMQALMRAS